MLTNLVTAEATPAGAAKLTLEVACARFELRLPRQR